MRTGCCNRGAAACHCRPGTSGFRSRPGRAAGYFRRKCLSREVRNLPRRKPARLVQRPAPLGQRLSIAMEIEDRRGTVQHHLANHAADKSGDVGQGGRAGGHGIHPSAEWSRCCCGRSTGGQPGSEDQRGAQSATPGSKCAGGHGRARPDRRALRTQWSARNSVYAGPSRTGYGPHCAGTSEGDDLAAHSADPRHRCDVAQSVTRRLADVATNLRCAGATVRSSRSTATT